MICFCVLSGFRFQTNLFHLPITPPTSRLTTCANIESKFQNRSALTMSKPATYSCISLDQLIWTLADATTHKNAANTRSGRCMIIITFWTFRSQPLSHARAPCWADIEVTVRIFWNIWSINMNDDCEFYMHSGSNTYYTYSLFFFLFVFVVGGTSQIAVQGLIRSTGDELIQRFRFRTLSAAPSSSTCASGASIRTTESTSHTLVDFFYNTCVYFKA